MKKVLVSGYIGFNNFGDEGIFYALFKHLTSLGVEISALCKNPIELEQKYNIKGYYYKNIFQILKAIMNCNILYSGGGSLLQNKTSNFSLYYYLFIIFAAKLFFKKVIIFSQGIEPIRGKFSETITKLILKTVDFVTVRDLNSLNYLKKLNIKAYLTSDPIYSLVENYKISDNKKGLIVQLRDTKNFNYNILDDLADILASYKDKIEVFSFQDEIDKDICLKFVKKLKTKNINAEFISSKDINTTIEIINNAKYVISTRLHGLIISHALKNNTFGLIYDEKIKTLTDELNIPNINLKKYSKEELNSKLKDFFGTKQNCKNYRKYDWSLTDKELL